MENQNSVIYENLLEICEKYWLLMDNKDNHFPLDETRKNIGKMVDTLSSADLSVWTEIIYKKSYSSSTYLPSHCCNVFILSVILGRKLDYSRDELMNLGLTALFHDIGMNFIPSKIFLKEGKLNEEELKLIQKHVFYTREQLEKIKGIGNDVIMAAFHEHERYDGKGYPEKIQNGAIHPWVGIISLCDTFEALIQPRPYRKRFTPYEAIKEIMTSGSEKFFKNVLKEFLSNVSLYPINTWVKLNSGEIARVSLVTYGYINRPEVEILFDVSGKKYSVPRKIDMANQSLLRISGALSPVEIEKCEKELGFLFLPNGYK